MSAREGVSHEVNWFVTSMRIFVGSAGGSRVFNNSQASLALAALKKSGATNESMLSRGFHATFKCASLTVGFGMHDLADLVLEHVVVFPC